MFVISVPSHHDTIFLITHAISVNLSTCFTTILISYNDLTTLTRESMTRYKQSQYYMTTLYLTSVWPLPELCGGWCYRKVTPLSKVHDCISVRLKQEMHSSTFKKIC